MFDLLSSEYGWSTEYIWSRTLREIDWRVRCIIDRQNLERIFIARINDKDITAPVVTKDTKAEVEISENQQQAMDKAFHDAKIRKLNGRR